MSFPNVTDIIATTIENRSGVIADNVTKNNALLTYINKKGNIQSVSGGTVILQEMSFAANGNAGFYSGYDVLPTAAQDVLTAAQFDIKQAAVPVAISGLEELQNSGSAQIIDLLESRIKVAESSMLNTISQGLYSDGTGFNGKQITGLAAAIPLANTSGTYGGIDRSVWTFWQNQKFKATTDGGAATTSLNIISYMNQLWAKLCRGSDTPDLILMDSAYFTLYQNALQSQQRFASADSASAGFTTIKYMNADVVLDGGIGGYAPAKTAYFINTDYLMFRPHKDRNMVSLGKRESINQDAMVQTLAWAGNLTCSGAQFQGVMQE